MLQALRGLFGSKKFITLIVGLIVAGAARFGLQVSGETAALILGVFAVLIGAQGAADFGKEAVSKAVCPNCSAAASSKAIGVSPGPGTTGAMTLVLLLGLGTLGTSPACGGNARQTQLRTAMTALNVAGDAFAAFDRAHQMKIVDQATSLAEGAEKLQKYKWTRDRVLEAFASAYHAIAAAAVLADDDRTLAQALLTARLALKAWDDLKGAAP